MEIKQFKQLDDLLHDINREEREMCFLAGGTDVMPALNKGILAKEVIYDLSNLAEELNFIEYDDDQVKIGALVTLSELINNQGVEDHLPQFKKAISSIGSIQIRNMATLTGNVLNASPVADSIPVLLSKEAVINLVSIDGERSIEISKFFKSYKNVDRRRNEVVKSISIPINKLDGKYDFHKIATRQIMAISKVNVAYAIEESSIHIAAGGIKEVPARLLNTEQNWNNKDLTRIEWKEIIAKDIAPIDDLYSTAEYRAEVLVNLIHTLHKTIN